MTYIPFLQSLEETSVAAILAARQFAEIWGDLPKLIQHSDDQEETLKTVRRLKSGDVFKLHDEFALEEVEKQLVDWFDTLSGTSFLEVDGKAGMINVIEAEQTKEVLSHLERYLKFRALRQEVLDRVAAEMALAHLRDELGSISI